MAVMNKNKSFTLSEVLITLTVIGVVAAITVPTLMPLIKERINSQKHANIVYKITQATNTMKSLGLLQKFNTTDDFVDELQKHLKIAKRCDSNHIAECWPTAIVTNADGVIKEVARHKTGADLGFENRNVNNVGLVLADGSSLILTYDPEHAGLDVGDAIYASAKELPVGYGRKEFLEFTTNTTGGLAFVADVNGEKGPNSETIGSKYNDIRNLNGASFAGCGGQRINGKCYSVVDSYSMLDCSDAGRADNMEYCTSQSAYADDYWAGANKACAKLGMKLPDNTSLQALCRSNKAETGLGSSSVWSSTTFTARNAYYVSFSTCGTTTGSKKSSMKVICVE